MSKRPLPIVMLQRYRQFSARAVVLLVLLFCWGFFSTADSSSPLPFSFKATFRLNVCPFWNHANSRLMILKPQRANCCFSKGAGRGDAFSTPTAMTLHHMFHPSEPGFLPFWPVLPAPATCSAARASRLLGRSAPQQIRRRYRVEGIR